MKLALILILGLSLPSVRAQEKINIKNKTRAGQFLENIFGKISLKELSPKKKDLDSDLVENSKETLADKMMPGFYLKRDKPILKAALVYHGDFYQETDLDRLETLITERFNQATNGLLSIEIVVKKILPYKHNISNYPDYSQPHVTEIDRLQRIWYYDNVNMKVVSEVYDEVKKELAEVDVLLSVTGAQFDGLAFAAGRVAITENPREIAWGLPGGGRTEIVTDDKVADSLIHELGHTLFLDHASSQCFLTGMSYKDSQACCAKSENAKDIMSYCRDREAVNETHFYKFLDCNLRTIKNEIIPALLSGGKWQLQNRERCF